MQSTFSSHYESKSRQIFSKCDRILECKQKYSYRGNDYKSTNSSEEENKDWKIINPELKRKKAKKKEFVYLFCNNKCYKSRYIFSCLNINIDYIAVP